jgi:ArsR family transcriptional regulator, arsenate/arsenite/antimonite-responsive transcriptional repressor
MVKNIVDKKCGAGYFIVMKLSNYSKIFKALSNEQRLKIFMMIYNGEGDLNGKSVFPVNDQSCCLMSGPLKKAFTKACDCMDLSRSTVSHHFKELQNAGLIICEREGQMYHCRVNPEAVELIKAFLK